MKKHTFYTFFDHLWSLFLQGLLLILPVAITLSIFSFTFKLIKSWLAPLKELSIPFISLIPHGEVFLVLGLILGAGLLFNSFIISSFIELFEHIITKVPLVSPVYSGVKQLVHAFSPQDANTFKKVVLVEFPRKGMYSIGFLTSQLYGDIIPKDTPEPFFNIFVPTTPNPTTGFFVTVPQSDFIITELTNQEAMALIISGGIIQPDRFKAP